MSVKLMSLSNQNLTNFKRKFDDNALSSESDSMDSNAIFCPECETKNIPNMNHCSNCGVANPSDMLNAWFGNSRRFN